MSFLENVVPKQRNTKIRTRLLLCLVPTLIAGITFISTLFSYRCYQQIQESFEAKLTSALLGSTNVTVPSQEVLEKLKERLSLDVLQVKPLKEVEIIPNKLQFFTSYEKEGTFLSAWMPIYDSKARVTGLMEAKIHQAKIDQEFRQSLWLISLSAAVAVILLIIALYLLAHRLSRPIQRLNNAALAIAAGNYGESIALQGPKEVAELANTLNTMSQCLHENINRLKETSFNRERFYQEHECAMLLQHLMLQKNIDDCHSDAVAIQSISIFSEEPKGVLLNFPAPSKESIFQIQMTEAPEEGFSGMYQLLTQSQNRLKQSDLFTRLDSLKGTLSYQGWITPIVWSLEKETFSKPMKKREPSNFLTSSTTTLLLEKTKTSIAVESGDFFFLFNRGLFHFYKDNPEKIEKFLSKVLRNFAEEGLEATTSMLQKELVFATKRQDLEDDIHLLCFQIL